MSNTEQYALIAASAMSIPGLVFLLGCRTLWVPAAASKRFATDLSHKDFTMWSALASHMSFIVGMLMWSMGCICAGLALEFPPALAILAGFSSAIVQLFFMVLFRTSPMGMPEVDGPPIPARILLIIIESTLIFNAYTGFSSGTYSNLKFFGLFVTYCVMVPVAVAKKHRMAGWENQPMAMFTGNKSS